MEVLRKENTRYWAVLNIVFAVLFLLASSGALGQGQTLREPSAALTDLQGKRHLIKELHGMPVVINFWATWCVPCKDEMPRLVKLQERYPKVRFVAISIDNADTRAKIPALIAKRKFSLTVWQGASADTLKELALGELVPATVILDADGMLVGRIEGEASEKDIASRLDWLLNGRQGKQPKLVQKNDW
ncbi:MAG TPA: TlpA disulfide reductase family protein [Bryobacteraceae bacterium]|nr:TlpA family protein disulfide reductase [Acidobacteriaceae bacterium]